MSNESAYKSVVLRLNGLAERFPGDGLRRSDMVVIPADEVPEPYHHLLVHNAHMTVTLERHHECRVALEIRKVRQEGNDYSRKLVLRAGDGGRVVMGGVMRIQLQYCSEKVVREIVEGEIPLGRILIENDVLRWIETEAYVRVTMNSQLQHMFEVDDEHKTAYGRIARIICDHEPAVELLEIVAPESL